MGIHGFTIKKKTKKKIKQRFWEGIDRMAKDFSGSSRRGRYGF